MTHHADAVAPRPRRPALSVRTVAEWMARSGTGDAQLEDRRRARIVDRLGHSTLETDGRQSWAIARRGRRAGRSAPTSASRGRAGLRGAGARRPQSGGPLIHHRSFNATSGPMRAISCTWTSNPSSDSTGSAIAFMGTVGRASKASAARYVHVAIDDATRVAYVEVSRSQRRRACDAFLRHALVWFAATAFASAACSPTTGGKSRTSDPASVARGRFATNLRDPTRRAPVAKLSASFKRCYASGPIADRISPPRLARPR